MQAAAAVAPRAAAPRTAATSEQTFLPRVDPGIVWAPGELALKSAKYGANEPSSPSSTRPGTPLCSDGHLAESAQNPAESAQNPAESAQHPVSQSTPCTVPSAGDAWRGAPAFNAYGTRSRLGGGDGAVGPCLRNDDSLILAHSPLPSSEPHISLHEPAAGASSCAC